MRALPAVLLALALGACDNPVGFQTDHLDAVEVIVRDAHGAEFARTVENRAWHGPAAADGLTVEAGAHLDLLVTFLTLEGEEVRLEKRPGLSLRLEVEPEGAVLYEPLDAVDRLLGLRPGRASVRFVAWHGTHADFVSPPLPFTVH